MNGRHGSVDLQCSQTPSSSKTNMQLLKWLIPLIRLSCQELAVYHKICHLHGDKHASASVPEHVIRAYWGRSINSTSSTHSGYLESKQECAHVTPKLQTLLISELLLVSGSLIVQSETSAQAHPAHSQPTHSPLTAHSQPTHSSHRFMANDR